MAGVWFVLTVITVVMAIPAILGSYWLAEYGSGRVVYWWLTTLTALLAVGVVLTLVVMLRL